MLCFSSRKSNNRKTYKKNPCIMFVYSSPWGPMEGRGVLTPKTPPPVGTPLTIGDYSYWLNKVCLGKGSADPAANHRNHVSTLICNAIICALYKI